MTGQLIADPKKIYIFRFPGETEVTGIAMMVDISMKKFPGIIFLIPENRGHAIRGKPGKKTKTGFTFISEGFEPGEWVFEELTYDMMKAGFYKHVWDGEQLLKLVHNTQELQDYYNTHFPCYP